MAGVKEDVNVKVSAEVAEMLKAWEAIADGPKALAEAIKRVGDLEGSTSQKMLGSLDAYVGRWVSAKTAIDGAVTAIKSFLDYNQRLRDERVTSTGTIEAGLTNYRGAAGNLSEEQGQVAAGRILAIAQESKASVEEAFGAATMLARFGAGRDQSEGEALRELLEAQDVASLTGGDPQALVTSILAILKRSGRPVTGESIRGLAVTAHGLTQAGTGFGLGQLSEFQGLAKLAADNGVPLPSAIAMWAAMRSDQETGRAAKEFRRLFDDNVQPGEAAQINNYLRRGYGLARQGGGEQAYAAAADIVGESMESRQKLANTQYTVSGYTPGAMSSDEIFRRFIAARRQDAGIDPVAETIASLMFNLQSWLWGPEQAITNITSGWTAGPRNEAAARWRERAMGREEFTVRLLSPDGRDIPVQVEANELNQDFSNDATQDRR